MIYSDILRDFWTRMR